MTPAADRAGEPQGGWLSIGEVLRRLRAEFPEVTISKIRFLEDQGLVEPARSPSGYRKFGPEHLARLRYVLQRQREDYLPLRVIRAQLEALDSGDAPQASAALRIGPTGVVGDGPRRHTREDVRRLSGADEEGLAALDEFGLLGRPGPDGCYGEEAVVIAAAATTLAAHGIEPRHLRAFKGAADREAGLVEQVVAPRRRPEEAADADRADVVMAEVLNACLRLHAALVSAALRRSP
ncbi:MAG: MerR family transcriptional regulator [Kineosporiaceae bacterium]